ncbi:hypothetical protein [Morganella morganii]|uniref:hypothetical protein n=1 Tax=Morganella morganii TaxID=582 RepID=UPI0013B46648|nr:hypothetical protein [Morganella morganii]
MKILNNVSINLEKIGWPVLITCVFINNAYGATYAYHGYGETSQLATISIKLNSFPAQLASPDSTLTSSSAYTIPIFGGVDSGPNTGGIAPFIANGYTGWAITGCSGCVMYLTGSWSGWSRLRCNGYYGTRGGFWFSAQGQFNASGRAGVYNRYATPKAADRCSSNRTIGDSGYADWLGMGYDLNETMDTALTVNVYVPMSVVPGTYSLPNVRIVQGIVDTNSNKFSYMYLTQNDYFTVPQRVTSCSISHPASVDLELNTPASSTLNWTCVGPEPTQMRIEMTVISGLPTSDGTGMALVPTGGIPSINGDGIIVRGTTKTGGNASCLVSADDNILYWNSPGKGGALPVRYSNMKTSLSWIACGTSITAPGKYQGAATLKFLYK